MNTRFLIFLTSLVMMLSIVFVSVLHAGFSRVPTVPSFTAMPKKKASFVAPFVDPDAATIIAPELPPVPVKRVDSIYFDDPRKKSMAESVYFKPQPPALHTFKRTVPSSAPFVDPNAATIIASELPSVPVKRVDSIYFDGPLKKEPAESVYFKPQPPAISTASSFVAPGVEPTGPPPAYMLPGSDMSATGGQNVIEFAPEGAPLAFESAVLLAPGGAPSTSESFGFEGVSSMSGRPQLQVSYPEYPGQQQPLAGRARRQPAFDHDETGRLLERAEMFTGAQRLQRPELAITLPPGRQQPLPRRPRSRTRFDYGETDQLLERAEVIAPAGGYALP